MGIDNGLTTEQALQKGVAAHREGKLQDAERLYRAILQSQPAHPDANHNLGVIAVSVNKADAALPLFKTALEANPKIEQFWLSYIDALIKTEKFDDARRVLSDAQQAGVTDANAWTNLGVAFQQEKRITDAKIAYEKALALNPKSAAISSNLGAMAREAGELESALGYFEKALEIEPNLAEAHSNLGSTLQGLGRLDEAEASYKQAIALQPDFANAHSNLGNTLKRLGRLDEAEASYTQAIALQPDFANAHSNLGNTLIELGRLNEAEASYTQAIALKPDFAEAHYNLGKTLKRLGRLDEAEASYTQAIALKADYTEAHNQLLDCLFLQDKKSVFFDELDYLINQDKVSSIIGSLACRSALKYGLEKPNLFCAKPLNYVLHNDLNTRYDFEKIFVEKAKSILNESRILNRRQTLLENGNQTSGNIFDIKNYDTNEIQNIIREEVEKYRTKFKESEEGLIKKMPAEYSLYGWFISMKSGGNLKPHIHTEGWLSGSIYINVPRKLKVDSGNLVVSLGEENDAIGTRINEKKTINVVTGSVVLFPASLMHYTIPFESEEERIVLAFDVREK
ncbi:tetratricopeptide repeat protein [OCS116 cluster bacterium]|nr:tetratricopeptide repeat protein [OCS116 cluster bacterium]